MPFDLYGGVPLEREPRHPVLNPVSLGRQAAEGLDLHRVVPGEVRPKGLVVGGETAQAGAAHRANLSFACRMRS